MVCMYKHVGALGKPCSNIYNILDKNNHYEQKLTVEVNT